MHSKVKIAVLFGIISLFLLAAMAFQDSSTVISKDGPAIRDTFPKSSRGQSDFDMKDFDKSMKDFDIQMKNLGEQLKDIDLEKIAREVRESISKIDMDKIKKEIDGSMKEIDMNKIRSEIDKSLKEIDYDKINSQIRKAFAEAKSSLNSDDLKKAMDEVKNINSDKIREEMNNLKKELEENKFRLQDEMDKARKELKESRENLYDAKALTDELEKDGLIRRSEGFSIEYRNNELYINNRKQPREVTDKYSRFLKNGDIKISSKEEK